MDTNISRFDEKQTNKTQYKNKAADEQEFGYKLKEIDDFVVMGLENDQDFVKDFKVSKEVGKQAQKDESQYSAKISMSKEANKKAVKLEKTKAKKVKKVSVGDWEVIGNVEYQTYVDYVNGNEKIENLKLKISTLKRKMTEPGYEFKPRDMELMGQYTDEVKELSKLRDIFLSEIKYDSKDEDKILDFENAELMKLNSMSEKKKRAYVNATKAAEKSRVQFVGKDMYKPEEKEIFDESDFNFIEAKRMKANQNYDKFVMYYRKTAEEMGDESKFVKGRFIFSILDYVRFDENGEVLPQYKEIDRKNRIILQGMISEDKEIIRRAAKSFCERSIGLFRKVIKNPEGMINLENIDCERFKYLMDLDGTLESIAERFREFLPGELDYLSEMSSGLSLTNGSVEMFIDDAFNSIGKHYSTNKVFENKFEDGGEEGASEISISNVIKKDQDSYKDQALAGDREGYLKSTGFSTLVTNEEEPSFEQVMDETYLKERCKLSTEAEQLTYSLMYRHPELKKNLITKIKEIGRHRAALLSKEDIFDLLKNNSKLFGGIKEDMDQLFGEITGNREGITRLPEYSNPLLKDYFDKEISKISELEPKEKVLKTVEICQKIRGKSINQDAFKYIESELKPISEKEIEESTSAEKIGEISIQLHDKVALYEARMESKNANPFLEEYRKKLSDLIKESKEIITKADEKSKEFVDNLKEKLDRINVLQLVKEKDLEGLNRLEQFRLLTQIYERAQKDWSLENKPKYDNYDEYIAGKKRLEICRERIKELEKEKKLSKEKTEELKKLRAAATEIEGRVNMYIDSVSFRPDEIEQMRLSEENASKNMSKEDKDALLKKGIKESGYPDITIEEIQVVEGRKECLRFREYYSNYIKEIEKRYPNRKKFFDVYGRFDELAVLDYVRVDGEGKVLPGYVDADQKNKRKIDAFMNNDEELMNKIIKGAVEKTVFISNRVDDYCTTDLSKICTGRTLWNVLFIGLSEETMKKVEATFSDYKGVRQFAGYYGKIAASNSFKWGYAVMDKVKHLHVPQGNETIGYMDSKLSEEEKQALFEENKQYVDDYKKEALVEFEGAKKRFEEGKNLKLEYFSIIGGENYYNKAGYETFDEIMDVVSLKSRYNLSEQEEKVAYTILYHHPEMKEEMITKLKQGGKKEFGQFINDNYLKIGEIDEELIVSIYEQVHPKEAQIIDSFAQSDNLVNQDKVTDEDIQEYLKFKNQSDEFLKEYASPEMIQSVQKHSQKAGNFDFSRDVAILFNLNEKGLTDEKRMANEQLTYLLKNECKEQVKTVFKEALKQFARIPSDISYYIKAVNEKRYDEIGQISRIALTFKDVMNTDYLKELIDSDKDLKAYYEITKFKIDGIAIILNTVNPEEQKKQPELVRKGYLEGYFKAGKSNYYNYKLKKDQYEKNYPELFEEVQNYSYELKPVLSKEYWERIKNAEQDGDRLKALHTINFNREEEEKKKTGKNVHFVEKYEPIKHKDEMAQFNTKHTKGSINEFARGLFICFNYSEKTDSEESMANEQLMYAILNEDSQALKKIFKSIIKKWAVLPTDISFYEELQKKEDYRTIADISFFILSVEDFCKIDYVKELAQEDPEIGEYIDILFNKARTFNAMNCGVFEKEDYISCLMKESEYKAKYPQLFENKEFSYKLEPVYTKSKDEWKIMAAEKEKEYIIKKEKEDRVKEKENAEARKKMRQRIVDAIVENAGLFNAEKVELLVNMENKDFINAILPVLEEEYGTTEKFISAKKNVDEARTNGNLNNIRHLVEKLIPLMKERNEKTVISHKEIDDFVVVSKEKESERRERVRKTSDKDKEKIKEANEKLLIIRSMQGYGKFAQKDDKEFRSKPLSFQIDSINAAYKIVTTNALILPTADYSNYTEYSIGNTKLANAEKELQKLQLSISQKSSKEAEGKMKKYLEAVLVLKEKKQAFLDSLKYDDKALEEQIKSEDERAGKVTSKEKKALVEKAKKESGKPGITYEEAKLVQASNDYIKFKNYYMDVAKQMRAKYHDKKAFFNEDNGRFDIWGCLDFVKFDEKGRVLSEYRKADMKNRKILEGLASNDEDIAMQVYKSGIEKAINRNRYLVHPKKLDVGKKDMSRYFYMHMLSASSEETIKRIVTDYPQLKKQEKGKDVVLLGSKSKGEHLPYIDVLSFMDKYSSDVDFVFASVLDSKYSNIDVTTTSMSYLSKQREILKKSDQESDEEERREMEKRGGVWKSYSEIHLDNSAKLIEKSKEELDSGGGTNIKENYLYYLGYMCFQKGYKSVSFNEIMDEAYLKSRYNLTDDAERLSYLFMYKYPKFKSQLIKVVKRKSGKKALGVQELYDELMKSKTLSMAATDSVNLYNAYAEKVNRP